MIRYNPKLDEGLNNSQVEYRFKNKDYNYNSSVKTKLLDR